MQVTTECRGCGAPFSQPWLGAAAYCSGCRERRGAALPLTPRQAQVLRLIYERQREEGRPASYRELMRVLGVRSPNGMRALLVPLVTKGYLRPLPGRGNRGAGAGRCLVLLGLRSVFTPDAAGARLRAALGED